MKIGVKHILLLVIMGFLFLPLLQENFNLPRNKKLGGDFVPARDTRLDRHKWLSKEFQEQKELFLHDNFGYHNFYIRLYNQIGFSIFRKAKANGVVIGKENYLYEQKYIDAYYGLDFLGVDVIREKMMMVSFLVDTFKAMNKTFLIVFAPGKGAYFPEYIPDNQKAQKGITNIEVYTRFAREMNVPHIDFHSWFVQQKDKTKYPLVPKYGIHWSQYGSVLATDSILKTIEQLRGIDVSNVYWKKVVTEKGKDNDIDIEHGMNLLFRLKPETMAYPEVLFEDSVGKVKPSVLVVADSYYWQIFSMGISNVFNRSDFWYYFKSANSPRFENKSYKMQDVDIIDEINKHEVIIIMSTDVHLPNFGWNFIESMYGYYKGTLPPQKLDPRYYDKIDEMKDYIRSDNEWMKGIHQKAKDRNISVDSMIYIDAMWSVDKNGWEK